ncbi:unnamed protein product, partial [Staurois parvus]
MLIAEDRAGSSLSDVGVQLKMSGAQRRSTRAVYRGSAEQRIGSRVCRVVYRDQQGREGSADLRIEDSGAESRGQQGGGQGSQLAGQRTGVTAGRAEDRGHCWQGTAGR